MTRGITTRREAAWLAVLACWMAAHVGAAVGLVGLTDTQLVTGTLLLGALVAGHVAWLGVRLRFDSGGASR